jgi:hypothetical protein
MVEWRKCDDPWVLRWGREGKDSDGSFGDSRAPSRGRMDYRKG